MFSKFQKILALSKAPSWRTRGLLAAAASTGIDIDIPPQPHITKEMIEAFRAIGPLPIEDRQHPNFGSSHAWLAHLDLVKFAWASGLESVLIVEDDVDWDTRLKSSMRLVSTAVREFNKVEESEEVAPYGLNWDVLWIGHCGENTNNVTTRTEFADPSVIEAEKYTGFAKNGIADFIKPGHRVIQKAIGPICTFGYAMTRRGMGKVLEWAGAGVEEAYDIKIMRGCKSGDLECLTVTPEVMHHYAPDTKKGYVSLVSEQDGEGTSARDEELEKEMGGTENIVRSARCHAVFGKTCLKKIHED